MTTVLRFAPLSALSLLLALPGCGVSDSGGTDASEDAETGAVASALVVPAAPACSAAKIAEVLNTVDGKDGVGLDCSLTLPDSTKTIKKTIFLLGANASGVTLDCHGSHLAPTRDDGLAIVIAPQKDANWNWSRPESITIKNCVIDGNITVNGMDFDTAKFSSFTSGHTARAQAAAPKNINLSNLTVTVKAGGTALFVGTGATYVNLTDSELKGTAYNRSAIDLDNESGYHTIKNNYIHISSNGVRQAISVDSSAHNKILGNIIGDTTMATHGGIYLYRNCGESGEVRQQTPSYNDIIGNVFFYQTGFDGKDMYNRPTPSIWIGARNTRTANGEIGYCDLDKAALIEESYALVGPPLPPAPVGAPALPPPPPPLGPFPILPPGSPVPELAPRAPYVLIGSALSDGDHASENVVAENKFYGRDPAEMLKVDDASNDLFSNVTVSTSVPIASVVPPSLGCALRLPAGRTVYLKHNTTFGVRTDLLVGDRYKCVDGTLTVTKGIALAKQSFMCSKALSNVGCSSSISCPAGKNLVGLKATCNLEEASLTSAQLVGTTQDTMRVGQLSDNVDEGFCTVGTQVLQLGSADVTPQLGHAASLPIACKEHDMNLGECVIQGEALCL
jgi:hypothetical protein